MALSQVLNLYKKKGETPLETIQRFKFNNPEYEKIKMTYAGRLDPMAEGVLLVLCGEEIKNKNKFLDLKKKYEAEVLFGFSTDTFDILGKVNNFDKSCLTKINEDTLKDENLNKFVGKFIQKYPKFSSKPFLGKPLFVHARNDSIDELNVPEKEVEIYSIKKESVKKISSIKLKQYVLKSINLVKGDFRQKGIIEIWESYLNDITNPKFIVLKILVECSSGTYIRSLAQKIGLNLFNVPSLALSIKRISVGNYSIAKARK